MCAAIFAQVVLIIVFITNKEEVSFYLRIEIFLWHFEVYRGYNWRTLSYANPIGSAADKVCRLQFQ